MDVARNNNNGNHTQQQHPKGQSDQKANQGGPSRWTGEGGASHQKRNNNNNQRKDKRGGRGGRGDGRRGAGGKDGERRKDGGRGRGGQAEENALVKQLYDVTKGYFERAYIENVLKENGNSFDKTLDYLNATKANSWANKVKKQEPFSPPIISISNSPALKSSPADIPAQHVAPPQQAQAPAQQVQQHAPVQPTAQQPQQSQNNNGAAQQPAKQQPKKNNNNRKGAVPQQHVVKQVVDVPQHKEEPKASQEEEYNADAKIEALQKQFDVELRGIEAKRQLLTALKEEVATFTADRDSQIDTLTKEREQLCIKRKNLEQELLQIQGRVEAIDSQVAHLKQEKVHKIRILEEKSRAVLDDK